VISLQRELIYALQQSLLRGKLDNAAELTRMTLTNRKDVLQSLSQLAQRLHTTKSTVLPYPLSIRPDLINYFTFAGKDTSVRMTSTDLVGSLRCRGCLQNCGKECPACFDAVRRYTLCESCGKCSHSDCGRYYGLELSQPNTLVERARCYRCFQDCTLECPGCFNEVGKLSLCQSCGKCSQAHCGRYFGHSLSSTGVLIERQRCYRCCEDCTQQCPRCFDDVNKMTYCQNCQRCVYLGCR
jgi:hypothetical protein